MSASPANIQYASSGIPIGVIFDAIFYRGVNTAGVITIPATPLSGNTGKLGTYVVESFDPKFVAKVIDRQNSIGADLDFALLRQAPTASATVQSSAATTPILLPGDCFEVVIGKDGDSTTDLPYARFVVTDASPAFKQGESHKQTVSLRLDRQNSGNLTQF